MYKKLNPPQQQSSSVEMSAVQPAFQEAMPPPAEPATVFDAPADAVVSSAANGGALVDGSQPISAPMEPPVATSEPIVAVPAPASYQPTVPADPQTQLQLANLDKRMGEIETSLVKISESLSQVKNQTRDQKVSTTATPRSLKAQSTRKVAQKKSKSANSEPSTASTADLPLQLRGVYPPQGEDRQAWVLDPKSGVITVVSKGVVIQGARVIKIESDYIQTSEGFIR